MPRLPPRDHACVNEMEQRFRNCEAANKNNMVAFQMFASAAGFTLPMQLKAPPSTTRLPRLVATAGSRRTASTTLVSDANASSVTSPGAARTASAMNCAAETPHGEPVGALAPVLPKPATVRSGGGEAWT